MFFLCISEVLFRKGHVVSLNLPLLPQCFQHPNTSSSSFNCMFGCSRFRRGGGGGAGLSGGACVGCWATTHEKIFNTFFVYYSHIKRMLRRMLRTMHKCCLLFIDKARAEGNTSLMFESGQGIFRFSFFFLFWKGDVS